MTSDNVRGLDDKVRTLEEAKADMGTKPFQHVRDFLGQRDGDWDEMWQFKRRTIKSMLDHIDSQASTIADQRKLLDIALHKAAEKTL